ncbi:hypothetical protein RHMOL_Rhmol10G0090300 [Rhododendron molle]|uniref:Uncharacterized protein n=1 Tax=Rhododendron molle TaxID=49168 RepID=A0ACC0M0L4_RHOML|nr:hypothetical protein RHMOL_Rhmol10G0090300 [Rhododendron molle]
MDIEPSSVCLLKLCLQLPGEYHLDLIVSYGAVPVIVPRVSGVHMLLDSFEPIHGVLLCEGEDIDPSFYETETSSLSPEELEDIRKLHASDTAIDKEKDTIELRLAKLCLERNIPYMGICRGSQVLNVASGGTLYQDIGKQLSSKLPENQRVVHMDYDNYDGHRHRVKVVENTPLEKWFKEYLEGEEREIMVNSYHHQGVKRLAQRFVPMAFGPDGLVEGFYDPDAYNPGEGKFIMGLQFHPERMRKPDSDEFDYPGCPSAYQEFVKAVIAYQKRLNSSTRVPKSLKLDQEYWRRREKTSYEVSLFARNLYAGGGEVHPLKESELRAGAEFLEREKRGGGRRVVSGDSTAAVEGGGWRLEAVVVRRKAPISSLSENGFISGGICAGKEKNGLFSPLISSSSGFVQMVALEGAVAGGFGVRWKVDTSVCSTGSGDGAGTVLLVIKTSCYCPNPPYVSGTCFATAGAPPAVATPPPPPGSFLLHFGNVDCCILSCPPNQEF